ncbi:MAG: HEAT repeat domain-containing protein [Candidatus Eremiobacteraeota bacterium]|nr:HEAT repeat domain-containing protein [Candidatus Eremiobacteraeota bacterium]
MKRPDDAAAHRPFPLAGATARYGPDKTVDVLHIDLHLTADLDRRWLDGVCTTTVRALDEPVSSLALDAVDFEVHTIERNGKTLEFDRRANKLIVHFDPPLEVGEERSFSVSYRVSSPRHGLFFIAPTPQKPHKVKHAWTQSQDENARYWFPCLDYPHEKQTTSATVVVPLGLFALSNGALVWRKDDLAEQTTSFRYEEGVPHSTYLVSLVVGPFIEKLQCSHPVPIYYYVLAGREEDGQRAFGKTPKMLAVLEKRIGTAYPYERYSQIAVADFIFGGMENTSATTQTDHTLHDARAHLDFSSDPLVAHELAHQWFGNLLTCRDWSHAWLNEGFATYFEAVFREADLGYDEYLLDIYFLIDKYVKEDSSRYRRAIVCNVYRDPIELFDAHLYEKGGAVLHMLRGELGEQRFWRSIARYVKDNAERNVETIDLIRAIEVSTGRNLRAFFDQWVFREGHPELEVSCRYDEKRKSMTVEIVQKQRIDEQNAAYRFEVDLGFCGELPATIHRNFSARALPGEQRLRVSVRSAHETLHIPLQNEPRLVRFDPGAFVLATVTYRFGTEFAASTLRADPDPTARIRAGQELAKDGSHLAVRALREAIDAEPFWGVLAELAHTLGSTRAPWAKALLLQSLPHPHPKVRRAVADALGEFRDVDVADALLAPAMYDESYFVMAAALHALGKTRDPRSFTLLKEQLSYQSWNAVVPTGAARGLGELADENATPLLIDATAAGQEEALRRAALQALARLGTLVESQRTQIVERIIEILDDPALLVQLTAISATEKLADPRFVPVLSRLGESAFDGRVRRDAREAILRIHEAQKVPPQVAELRGDVDSLREEHRKLQAKIEELARS